MRKKSNVVMNKSDRVSTPARPKSIVEELEWCDRTLKEYDLRFRRSFVPPRPHLEPDEFPRHWSIVPADMRQALAAYITDHVDPGEIWRAILSRNFKTASRYLDLSSLWRILVFLHRYPRVVWGSRKAVDGWIKAGKHSRR